MATRKDRALRRVRVNITVAPETLALIDDIARRAHVTRSAAIERAILTMPLPRMMREGDE